MRSQRGVGSVELVLYTPILFMLIFIIIQFALTWHGNQVAAAVARYTARVARVEGGTVAAIALAEQQGRAYAEQIGGAGLVGVDVVVEPVGGGDQVRATVSGRAIEIVDGWSPRVQQVIQGPVETFRPDL
ncbi:MAG: TadE/TadG family type IV pilus assembly protein [Jiangellaceae bacterium]